MAIALLIIFAIVLIKYKPVYKITISDQEIGYVNSKTKIESELNEKINKENSLNVAFVTLENEPTYEYTFVDRNTKTNEQEVLSTLEENSKITYRLFAITINNEPKAYVNSNDEAEKAVEEIKAEDIENLELDIKVIELYTSDLENIDSTEFTVAKTDLENAIQSEIVKKECTINGVALATKPISGTITSRYGAIDSIRGGRAHSGLDIAAPTGTSIKAVAKGTVTFAGYSGGYGYLVKISHGNNVETYYGHCSKLYVKQGQEVEEGEIIAAVGSTGLSSGSHLHLEIRLNGITINPQKYMYK